MRLTNAHEIRDFDRQSVKCTKQSLKTDIFSMSEMVSALTPNRLENSEIEDTQLNHLNKIDPNNLSLKKRKEQVNTNY